MHHAELPEQNLMKDTLQPGLVYEFRFRVPETKTVPQLFPEAAEFQQMPEVFATGVEPIPAGFIPRARASWGAVLGARRAVWSFQTSGEQQRNAPQLALALRVASRKRVCGVARLGNGTTIARASRLAAIAFWTQRGV